MTDVDESDVAEEEFEEDLDSEDGNPFDSFVESVPLAVPVAKAPRAPKAVKPRRRDDVHLNTPQPAKEIIRWLEKCTYVGRRQDAIFEDWVTTMRYCLQMLPVHAKAAATTGRMAEDPPEIAKHWERLRERYKPDIFEAFTKAFTVLLAAAEDSWDDIIGDVYMAWGYPSTGHGQFFTPSPVAQMMAQIAVGDGEREIIERLLEAMHTVDPEHPQDPVLDEPFTAYQFMGMALDVDHPETVRYVAGRHWAQVSAKFRPVEVLDCAVGSGVLLLAAASV